MSEYAMITIDTALWELVALWLIVWTWHGGILFIIATKQAAKFEPSYRPVVLALFGPIGWVAFILLAIHSLLTTRNGSNK